ncbi:MAG: MFS transporter [Pseudomonadota bacterium]
MPDTLQSTDDTSPSRSPVSGVDSAAQAGRSFWQEAQAGHVRRTRRGVRTEFPAYLSVQTAWFMAFGMQVVLYPHLITNRLQLNGTELGIAQLALAAPSVVFLLFGGVLAERASGKTLLFIFHLLASLPALGLGYAMTAGVLNYPMVVAYGLGLGIVGAFMMPARDAVLNEVVGRRSRIGSGVTLQQAVAFSVLAQFAAQIIGILIAGYADRAPLFLAGWVDDADSVVIHSWMLMLVQGGILAAGAIFALSLARGRRVRTGRNGIGAAFGDIAEGFRAVNAKPELWAMTILMFGVGVLVIGSFLTVLPIINREEYNGGSDGLREMFLSFWIGAFISSVAMSAIKKVKRPGQVLLISQLAGSAVIVVFFFKVPWVAFLSAIFVGGLSAGVSITMSRAIVQDAAPRDQLARVLSIYQLGFMAGTPIGAAVMGALTDVVGHNWIAAFPVTGMALLIAWVLLKTPIWTMRNGVKPAAH